MALSKQVLGRCWRTPPPSRLPRATGTAVGRGGLGARLLNIELQKALNPPGEAHVERFGWTFGPGDKVMQIENDYDH